MELSLGTVKPLRDAFYYGKLGVSAVALSRHPDRTDLVFVVNDCLHKLNKFGEVRRVLSMDDAAMQLISERTLLEKFSLEALAGLPQGSLGRTYADHMRRWNLKPDFFPWPEEITDETYVFLRMRQTHDLWHVVTGFDTSPIGEVSLQTFQMAQVASPLSVMIVGSAILRCAVIEQDQIHPLMDGVRRGWEMGQKATRLFSYDWAAAWPKDLAVVRRELEIEPC